MKIDQWKQKVKEKVIEKEYHKWIATSIMYTSVKEIKSLEVCIKNRMELVASRQMGL